MKNAGRGALHANKRRARTKPKPAWSGIYQLSPVPMSPKDAHELAEILYRDPSTGEIRGPGAWPELLRDVRAMRRAVAQALGGYPSMRKAFDEQPRPAHQLAWLNPILDHAKALRGRLASGDDLTVGDLWLDGFRLPDTAPEILAGLDGLVEAGERARARLSGRESRHGRTLHARDEIVRRLGRIFDFYYTGTEDARQRCKADFVHDALKLAKIPAPEMSADVASQSRLVRMVNEIAPPSPLDIAAGRGQPLTHDRIWSRMSNLAAERAAEVSAFLNTSDGRVLYGLYSKYFEKPLIDLKHDERRELEAAGVCLSSSTAQGAATAPL